MLGLQRKSVSLVVCTFAFLGAAACGDSTSSSEGDGGGTGGTDAGDTTGGGGNGECGVDPKNTKGTAATASVTGVIRGGAEASGDLYIAIMPEFNPLEACPGSATAPTPVANYLVRCVDLGEGEYTYKVDGVPVGEEFSVVPFMDVNGNIDPSDPKTAGPDACDLISTGVKFTAKAAGETVMADPMELGSAGVLVAVCGLDACAK